MSEKTARQSEYAKQAEQLAAAICSKEPLFGNACVSIVECGAVPSTEPDVSLETERRLVRNNTRCILQAIRCVARKPLGGTVLVPKGIFYVSAIHLESHVRLHLEKGAVLRFAREPWWYQGELLEELYGERLVHTRFEGVELMNYSPFIYAYGKEQVAVTGEGTLDGQASEDNWHWWKNRKNPRAQDAARTKLFLQGEGHVPVKERCYGEASGAPGECDDGYLRPSFIQFYHCKDVLIEGVIVIRSPMWEIHPVLCENVIIRNLHIDTHLSNNDGIDPESCRGVLIEGCRVDVGDDCIAIKSGRNADARRIGVGAEDIVIRDNVFADGHGGITIGSEVSCGVRNVYIYRNVMDSPDLWTALRMKSNSIRGGIIEKVYYWDNEVRRIQEGKSPVLVEMAYETVLEHAIFDEHGAAYEEETPMFRDIHIAGLGEGDARILGGVPEIMWE